MPKALSLKKAQPGSQKNQKAITQFFRNTNESAITRNLVSSSKSENNSTDKSANKRKALSPISIESEEVQNIKQVSDVEEYQSCNASTNGCAKKIKIDPCHKSPNKCRSLKKSSPQKENGVKSSLSPKKLVSKEDKVLEQIKEERLTLLDKSKITLKTNLFSDNQNNEKQTDNHVGKKSTTLENHVQNCDEILQNSNRRTPVESPQKKDDISPRNKLRTPQNDQHDEWSPSKSGPTVNTLDFAGNEVNDLFDDDWAAEDIEEECPDTLDLSTLKRCEVISVLKHPSRLELRLKSCGDSGTCFVEGIWLDTPLHPGEIISVQATRDSSGSFSVGNGHGLLVLRPDHLVSSTSVVAGVFCRRKAVLQERWRGIDSANTAMTTGILIHELVQKALTEQIMDISRLSIEADKIIKESIQMLYDTGITEEETRSNMQPYIPSLAQFMNTYMAGKPQMVKKDMWNGHIDKVLDIEENVCCPQLGLKGKIDATLKVTIHNNKGVEKATVPLELKSGKASVSAEHRGQLVLYGMMLDVVNLQDPTTHLQRALLLYLRDKVDLREVSCGYPERRDLLMLRNQLVQYLAAGPEDTNPEHLVDIEEASVVLQQNLPEPVHHQNACAKCPYLTICSLHLWHTAGPTVTENHPLVKLRDEALGFLSKEHIRYFLHWTALIKMEERDQTGGSPLHALWTESVEKRVKRGVCIADLKIKSVEAMGEKYLHTLERLHNKALSKDKSKGPQEGEYSIVSIEGRPWIAAGVITRLNEQDIQIVLERDLSKRSQKGSLFFIDTYESYGTAVQNLTNLGVLMEDSDRASRLRKIIIDKEPAVFDKKLPREVGRLGTKLMKSLNIDQQRAVLKAIAAKDYALLRGLPGTGKTQTISVLIQMLVGLKQRVLVTAHTHSAVDTVLSRLPESMRVMRLGASSRVQASLLPRCEQSLAEGCETVEQLAKLYESMEVVGVTCLGAAHALLSKTTFDVCIVDEATQVLQCTVLRPLFAAKRFVLVGDPDQLPPVVKSRPARRLGMEMSLFHSLISEEATSTLQLQYRMNQAIVDVANKVAYNDRLKCADENVAQAKMSFDAEKLLSLTSENQWLLKACSVKPEDAVLFIDLKKLQRNAENNKKLANTDEACLVMALIEALIKVANLSPLSGHNEEHGSFNERRLGMEMSLFHSLISEEATSTLQLQYRMNQAIVDVANKVAYNDRLKCADENVAQAKMSFDAEKLLSLTSENQWLLKACSVKPEDAVLFIDLKKLQRNAENNKKLANTDEACLVMALIEALIKGGIKPNDIGVIAPYREQVSLLRRCLNKHNVEASTVDQFQGKDKSVILYSCTRKYMENDCKSKEGEVLNDQRRLAVSVTRAKHKMIIIGDSRALSKYVPVQNMLNACQTLEIEKKFLDHVIDQYCKIIS